MTLATIIVETLDGFDETANSINYDPNYSAAPLQQLRAALLALALICLVVETLALIRCSSRLSSRVSQWSSFEMGVTMFLLVFVPAMFSLLLASLELTDIIERGVIEPWDSSECELLQADGKAECCGHDDCLADVGGEAGYCFDNGFGGTRTAWDNIGKCSNTEGFQATACCFDGRGDPIDRDSAKCPDVSECEPQFSYHNARAGANLTALVVGLVGFCVAVATVLWVYFRGAESAKRARAKEDWERAGFSSQVTRRLEPGRGNAKGEDGAVELREMACGGEGTKGSSSARVIENPMMTENPMTPGS